ncbi:uncharacterized protein Dvar_83620 [Desulfosarcina variabilis str. Montpellier]|uniref:HEAT repeat domain-containing protein n=1 Tax=Desulfosarcina variabilis TaxID=2300 RepID=UPI003AFB6356
MQQVRKARLYFKEGGADKVYEVELLRFSKDRYVVNFRYGRRGGRLREGTKTLTPVDRQKADAIFDSVVVSKRNKGYRDSDHQPKAAAPSDAAGPGPSIEAALIKRFQNALHSNNPRQLRRAVWRIGELAVKSAVPDLAGLIPARDELLNYCVAWALGRCADPRAYPALDILVTITGAEAVKRMAQEALLTEAGGTGSRGIADKLIETMPPPVQAALAAEDLNQLAAAAAGTIFKGGPEGMHLLETLYRVSAAIPLARAFILPTLAEIPVEPGYFKAIRYIYKAAEFRFDAEVVGLLARRFETEKAWFYLSNWSRQYVTLPSTWEYVKLKEEIVRPDSRLAYSSRTRNYLRRRAWRMLRRLGDAANPQYVDMAVGMLLAFTDAHAVPPKKTTHYSWQQGADGRWQSVPVATREYGPYGGCVAFNHILRAHDPGCQLSPNGLSWLRVAGPSSVTDTEPPPRYEVFPELWDKRPDALWTLIAQSRCEPVHGFAARALMDQVDFCRKLTTQKIQMLLSSPYTVTILLGLSLSKDRYDPSAPDVDLIQALLAADLDDARQIARGWVEDQPDLLVKTPGLMAFILTCGHADVRQWGHTLIARVAFDDADIEMLIARLVAFLLGLDDRPDFHDAIIADIASVMLGGWAKPCQRMDVGIIADLLYHPLTALKALAGRLLLNHHTSPDQLPPALIRALIEAESSQVRGIGVQLFSGLPDAMLLGHADLIHAFCIADDVDVRRAAHPMVKRLAQADHVFGRDLFDRLFPAVFRKAPSPEFRDDLVALLSDALAGQAAELDAGTIWRLLQARARGAGQLGAALLAKAKPQILSIRQWARLGNHALLAVRQWGWQAYADHPSDIAGNMTDGLRILDSDWDDTRAFAIDYFKNRFDAAHWTPTLLVSICDSVRDDVQQFGRELITTFFDSTHGVDYLLKLSQHPSIDVQLFASNFLEDYAHGDLARIEQLTPYFLTVLSQVNCGRIAKARIFDLLDRLAVESAEAAARVAPVLNRVSATMAIGDRGRCVQILNAINRRYPMVATHLTPIAVQRRPIKTGKARHAV